jgi:hypothetical protein
MDCSRAGGYEIEDRTRHYGHYSKYTPCLSFVALACLVLVPTYNIKLVSSIIAAAAGLDSIEFHIPPNG